MQISAEGASRGAPRMGLPPTGGDSKQLLGVVLTTLDDAKAEQVVSIDLIGKTTMGDTMVVASGRSQRHVGALADLLIKGLKNEGYGRVRVEGLPHCDWVLVDAGDVIIHLFRPEVREFYNLEKMWAAERPSELLAG